MTFPLLLQDGNIDDLGLAYLFYGLFWLGSLTFWFSEVVFLFFCFFLSFQ